MSIDRRVHVLGLNPREQFLLKIALANLMAGYIDKSIQEATILKTNDEIDQKSAVVMNVFQLYNEFVDMLCPESMLGRARGKVLLIESRMMKYLVAAVNGYDPKANMVNDRYRNYLNGGFDELKKKVVESSTFTYNQHEVDRARNSGQS